MVFSTIHRHRSEFYAQEYIFLFKRLNVVYGRLSTRAHPVLVALTTYALAGELNVSIITRGLLQSFLLPCKVYVFCQLMKALALFLTMWLEKGKEFCGNKNETCN